MNYLRTRIEVWPVAASDQGVWLLSGGGPWTGTDAVPSDSNPWWEMEALLREHGIRPSRDDVFEVNGLFTAVVNHQTSNRWNQSGQIDTFITVLADDVVLPGALPISMPVVTLMGQPATHASTAAPEAIRDADVLLHALRHLRHLCMFDATARRDMPPKLARHLEQLEPALAGLYQRPHEGLRDAA